jgi:hypothetical protein
MSTNTLIASSTKEVPFFARFLEEQSSSEQPTDPPATPPVNNPPQIYTFKFPSDWEDR